MKDTTNATPVVLVTGGSRGIGRATCLAFAKAGYDVAVNFAGNESAAQETADACRALNPEGKIAVYRADVADADAVDALFKKIKADYGRLDVLVNNAGITRDNLIALTKPEDFDAVIATDLRGVFLCMKAAGRMMMRQRHGRIINVSSVVGLRGNAGQVSYAAAKAGVIGMTKSLAKELGRRNVTVNAVAPGFIQTDMTDALDDKQKDAAAKDIPLNRLGTPEDVAGVIAFLASDAASYITGQVIPVDGGMAI
ncbi:3-oxoacyl-[acyl-carrier-protein] reductase [Pseudoramibacter sp.]|jgi:3-oxoacyl-[acyl-carrier protein] reductase|uniref:3-oxoacyl-[acyl-carrier-protein] reductase n=1 Tax=Pseudoramibacter sp. TaxID=2034862 RepID=UPI0025FF8CAB|nr:3-oxoacyl-[acyl-carrier-protein] reductase [Pseudoramibacter sp.]MCH4072270.1 3-oxoacyl-[acyl-carrier-protein] reductase [Pseudoramibacter sp.]MCH4106040.1 3-oxoacyl-[acyl-carrier-protein] reductase [Pseudoramibacter sp.]